jgi:hypothetical protein
MKIIKEGNTVKIFKCKNAALSSKLAAVNVRKHLK